MAALGDDPAGAVHLNLPSVNAPVMPGRVGTVRTVRNVTDRRLVYRVEVEQPEQGEIRVSPRTLAVGPGESGELRITIAATSTGEQQFGAIRLVPQAGGLPVQRVPVAFLPQQGEVALASACRPASIGWLGASTCTVTATNHAFTDQRVDLRTRTDAHLLVAGVDGAAKRGPVTVALPGARLAAATPGSPSLAPGDGPAGGWVSLAELGVSENPVGSGSILNFTVPEFGYGHATYDQIGVTTNGYAVAGGGAPADLVAEPPGIPDPARPNNLLAPFWTDLDGRDAAGVRAAVLEVGEPGAEALRYLVFEWEVYAAGTTDVQVFQLWLGLSGEEDISFAYDPDNLPSSPHPLEVGAENLTGSGGDTLGQGVAPTEDLVVTSSDLIPGGEASYRVQLRGIIPGTGTVTSTMVGDALPGTTVVTSTVKVTPT
jgi:hypothetical protein